MKNQWIEFFSGIVTIKVSGRGIERFLNQLTKNEIMIWNVKKHGSEAVVLKLRLQDINKLRAAARGSQCKIKFIGRSGGPFLLKRLWTNGGLLVGAVLFLAVIMMLSNMVWGIEVKGANPATEYQIRKELDEMGVKIGKSQLFLKNVEEIQQDLTNNVPSITWVGVELRGTTFHFQVVEKTEPEKPEYYSPRHLVAKKKAIIVDMFVEKGEPVVEVNDHVKPGDLLVSGIIGKDGETQVVPSIGKVMGETWYKSTVTLPIKSTFFVFNGKEKRKYYVNVGGFSIPIWGFGKPEFKEYEKATFEKKLRFLKWEIPISYVDETYREREKVTRIYSNEEAIKEAKEMARKEIKSRLPEEAIIKGEKVLHQSIENGKVELITHFQIIENIAIGQPIIQGD